MVRNVIPRDIPEMRAAKHSSANRNSVERN